MRDISRRFAISFLIIPSKTLSGTNFKSLRHNIIISIFFNLNFDAQMTDYIICLKTRITPAPESRAFIFQQRGREGNLLRFWLIALLKEFAFDKGNCGSNG